MQTAFDQRKNEIWFLKKVYSTVATQIAILLLPYSLSHTAVPSHLPLLPPPPTYLAGKKGGPDDLALPVIMADWVPIGCPSQLGKRLLVTSQFYPLLLPWDSFLCQAPNLPET